MTTARTKAQEIELLGMVCTVRRGKRRFEVMARREAKNGFRTVTIVEAAKIDVYHIPIAEFPKFYSGMWRRLLDHHVRGLLRNKPRPIQETQETRRTDE